MNELQTTRTLDVVAAEIRTFTASMLNNVIEIGRRFVEAKEMLPYGEFGKWVEQNTAYKISSANNFMRLFNEYGSAQGCLFGAETDSQTFGKLSYSKALALLAVPAEEREEFAVENDVEHMSTRELERLIRERDEAIRQRDEAEQQFAASEKLHADLADKYSGQAMELEAAKRKITELESRPVEVAVQEPDQAAVQKQVETAVDEALKRAKEFADKEKKALKDKLDAAETRGRELSAEAEKLKKAASDAEKKAVEQQAGLVSMEKERLEREIEGLKKQLAMSDATVASFKVLFDQAQDILGRVIDTVGKIADPETAERLRAAVRKLLEAYGEKVKGDG